MLRFFVLLSSFCAFNCPAWGETALPDGKKIEELTRLKGKMDESEGVFKVTLPRHDIQPEAGAVKITPPLGLTAWASFKRTPRGTMLMGDLVLTEGQINSVMDTALAGGLEVTALHNHFIGEQPRVLFMHIGGMGDEQKLAKAVGDVFAKLKQNPPPPASPTSPVSAPAGKLDTKKISAILGPGELSDGVFKVTIGRTVKMHGVDAGKGMGVNTWAAFAGSDKEAVVDGDFAMLENEVQAVLKALRAAGLQVVALHNHMTMESPRMMFLHYWGTGPAEKLAQGVQNALKTQNL